MTNMVVATRHSLGCWVRDEQFWSRNYNEWKSLYGCSMIGFTRTAACSPSRVVGADAVIFPIAFAARMGSDGSLSCDLTAT